ncbi:hypothetical protein V8C86DRAFT_2788053 [Haematococcus lacustris]
MPDVEIAVTIAEIGFEERIWVTVGANYKDQRVTHPLTLDSDAQKLEWNAYFVALIVLHLRRVRPYMPYKELRALLKRYNYIYPEGWQEPPTNGDLCDALHNSRLVHAANARKQARIRVVKEVGSPNKFQTAVARRMPYFVQQFWKDNPIFPREDGLALAKLDEDYDDVSQALSDLPQEYRPSMAPRGGGALYPPPPVRADSIFVK